jgi:two-component system alkaline phosphatase synthesis response regulator PhoP
MNWSKPIVRREGCILIQPLRILIAEDEYLIRWFLTEVLSREGYQVVAVENGRKAIEVAQRENFDFIITDLMMPEVNGWEILDFVRQSQHPSRVIIIDASGKEDTEKIAMERGALAYVEKPYIIDRIKGILQESIPNLP